MEERGGSIEKRRLDGVETNGNEERRVEANRLGIDIINITIFLYYYITIFVDAYG